MHVCFFTFFTLMFYLLSHNLQLKLTGITLVTNVHYPFPNKMIAFFPPWPQGDVGSQLPDQGLNWGCSSESTES